jgi:hypothetical protein
MIRDQHPAKRLAQNALFCHHVYVNPILRLSFDLRQNSLPILAV